MVCSCLTSDHVSRAREQKSAWNPEEVQILTCDVGEPEAFCCQTVIGVKVDPDVVL